MFSIDCSDCFVTNAGEPFLKIPALCLEIDFFKNRGDKMKMKKKKFNKKKPQEYFLKGPYGQIQYQISEKINMFYINFCIGENITKKMEKNEEIIIIIILQ